MANVIRFVFIFASLSSHVVFGVSPPVTIKTKNGQTFKCVDFYNQPAFRNLSLNEKVMTNILNHQQQQNVSDFGLGSLGCPLGTVPLLEHTKTPLTDGPPLSQPRPNRRHQPKEHCSARVRTVYNAYKKFNGAGGSITIYRPAAQTNQWSSSRIKLLNGADSIEVGWMVNPKEFKDNEAHIYVSFSAGGKGCINTDCPGFVVTSSYVPLGAAAHAYSTRDTQIVWNVYIEKHQDDGNWWLYLNNDKGKHYVGYWPKKLFTTLAGTANQVEFGGEINDPSASNPPPEMGNGKKAVYDTTKASCFVHCTVVDEDYNTIAPVDTQKFSDCSDLYNVLDAGSHGPLGRIILYGGPN